MTSLGMTVGFTVVKPKTKSFVPRATKNNVNVKEETGPFDWILKAMERDHFLETDPILAKVEDKSGTVGTKSSKKSAPPAPEPKKKFGGLGGLGGLFPNK